MNTLVELFDSCQIENIVSYLKFKPPKIIFIGFSDDDFTEKYNAIKKMIKKQNQAVAVEYVHVPRYNYQVIVQKLEKIIADNADCFFDLTGGKELVLVAMGSISTKYNIPIYQIDIATNKIMPVSCCENFPKENNDSLTLLESITLNCGILEQQAVPGITHNFMEAVQELWSIAKPNSRLWNIETKALITFEKNFAAVTDSCTITCALNDFRAESHNFSALLHSLKRHNLITLQQHENLIRYQYKSDSVRHFLEKSGNILESYIYSVMKSIEKDCSDHIHDVSMQVVVRWLEDGQPSHTSNEIDVACMCGNIPAFISCKNGKVDKNALYELHTVANRLGGKYAKKILVVTDINSSLPAKAALLSRAQEMNIAVISDVDKLSEDKLKEQVKMALFIK